MTLSPSFAGHASRLAAGLRPSPGATTGPRRDVQGLRAFAVLVVVLDHLLGWPRGGFVGVDVFFVISGFLITGILLREHERTGHISFGTFYRRRIKRIMPAATLVLLATVLGAYLVFNTSRFRSTVGDAVYALLFSGNWRFALQSTDYFAQDRPTSPVQQFWSLGVEEQFYFVWPWLMLLVFTVAARAGRSRGLARGAVAAVLLALTLASFAWSLWETSNVPDRAYFSTLSRAWELGVGALLAVATPVLVRLPGWSRPVLSWTGLLGMTASVFVITAELAFPAPAALLPVLSTALVIAGGTGVAQQRYLAPLTNGVSQYVGDISYSLYLWHFPIIILGFTVWGSTPTTQLLLGIALLVVSAYSFHLVEDPVRRSDWLTSGRRPSLRRRGASRGPRLTPGQRVGWQSLTVVAAVALIAGLQASVPDRQPVVAAAPSAEGAADEDALPEATRALRTEVRSALAATEWPETDPSLDEAAGAAQAPDEVLQCGTETVVDVERCSWGPEDAENTVVVVGDSIAMTYVTTLRTALEDWRVVSMGGFGCTFTEPLIANDVPELEQACPARKQAAVDTINELEPDLVVVTNVQYPRLPAGAEEALTEAEWSTATLALVEEFRASAGTVVFLAPPPADKDLSACYSRVSTPEDCVSVVTQEWLDRAATERAMAEEVGGAWIDSSTWFCVERRCPAYVGSTPTKVDTTHMTPAFAEKIAPALEEALEAQDLL